MINWEKTGRIVKANGESTVTYSADNDRFVIQSRKRAIPHAGGRPGCWMHTSYWLIDKDDGTEKEYWSLRDAKEAAQRKGGDERD